MLRITAHFIAMFTCFFIDSLASAEYKMPSQELVDLVDAPRSPRALITPDGNWIAFLQPQPHTMLEELAEEEFKLAGLRIDPKSFSRSRQRGYVGITFKNLKDLKEHEIELPAERIFSPSWSPNSQEFSFLVKEKGGIALWSVNLKNKTPRKLSKGYLNGTVVATPFEWLPDSSGILALEVVSKKEDYPEQDSSFIIPIIQETTGKKAPARTFQDLIESPRDEALFSYFAGSRLVSITPQGKIKDLKQSGLIKDISASPDSKQILVKTIEKPFSYSKTYDSFPAHVKVIKIDGSFVKTIAEQEGAENVPQGYDSVVTGRRSIQWRNDKPSTLVWYEALDGGDMKTEVEFHDAAYSWTAPFAENPVLLKKFSWRLAGFEWSNKDTYFALEWRFSDRQLRKWHINGDEAKIIDQRSYNDRYKDPGDFYTGQNIFGKQVVYISGNDEVLLTSIGASPKGNIPFLDRYNLRTGKKTRLWNSKAPYYERVAAILSTNGDSFLSLKESNTEPGNFHLINLKTGSSKQITSWPHPYPQYKDIKKERLTYKRADGIDLSGTLYLPGNYDKSQGPLPVIMWAYPLEYKDKDVAGQVKESPYQFKWVGYWGPMPYLAKGYAVFDDPTMPIVGNDDTQPNDTFIPQLVSSAEAAVKLLVERGVADPNRIAISGHSYGAFMVANLLAHTDLFAAGIARSGAYNRSLTPFGFQGEERDFWEGQDVYATVSPFFSADKINEPILFIHGDADNNAGTYPMQSKRMFSAIKGLGGTARLVMLPYESHGYRARESILHVLWEQETWLNKYVKNRKIGQTSEKEPISPKL